MQILLRNFNINETILEDIKKKLSSIGILINPHDIVKICKENKLPVNNAVWQLLHNKVINNVDRIAIVTNNLYNYHKGFIMYSLMHNIAVIIVNSYNGETFIKNPIANYGKNNYNYNSNDMQTLNEWLYNVVNRSFLDTAAELACNDDIATYREQNNKLGKLLYKKEEPSIEDMRYYVMYYSEGYDMDIFNDGDYNSYFMQPLTEYDRPSPKDKRTVIKKHRYTRPVETTEKIRQAFYMIKAYQAYGIEPCEDFIHCQCGKIYNPRHSYCPECGRDNETLFENIPVYKL